MNMRIKGGVDIAKTGLHGNVGTSPAAVNKTQSVTAAQAVGAVGDVFIGSGGTQEHGNINHVAVKVFQDAVKNTDVTEVKGQRPRMRDEIPRPWEDSRTVVEHGTKTVKAAELGSRFVFEFKAGAVDDVLKMWASTTHAHLWTTPTGKAMANFAISRYGQAALQHDKRGKLHHVVEVLINADRVAIDNERRGYKMPQEWRNHLEYAALLHDIGYANGGFMHPTKGANDLLYNMRGFLEEAGVSTKELSTEDLEKIAMIVDLHAAQFPWDRVDPHRLAGGTYLTVRAAEEVVQDVAGGMQKFRETLISDNKVSRQETGGLKWLSDPKQLEELFRVGWVMHCADNYNGPTKEVFLRGKGTLGRSEPIESLGDLRDFESRNATSDALRGISRFFTTLMRGLGAKSKPIEAPLQRLDALVDSIADDIPKSAADTRHSVLQLLESKEVKAVQTHLNKLSEADVKNALKEILGPDASPTDLDALFVEVIRDTAGFVGTQPDRRS